MEADQWVGAIRMYMKAINFGSNRNAQWCDNAKQAEAGFLPHFDHGPILVNDGACTQNAGTLEVKPGWAWALLAKNKATLLSALKVCPQALKLVSTDGGLGMFTGSYDHEKIGAWLQNKNKGTKAWKDFKQSDAFQGFRDRGFNKQTFRQAHDRLRLAQRAYFVVVAPASAMRNNSRCISIHQTEAALSAIPGFLSGKLSKDEAVDKLFDDLLIS